MNSEQLKAYIGVANYKQLQANWNETKQDSVQFIQNKPDIAKIEGDISTLQGNVSNLQGNVVNLNSDDYRVLAWGNQTAHTLDITSKTTYVTIEPAPTTGCVIEIDNKEESRVIYLRVIFDATSPIPFDITNKSGQLFNYEISTIPIFGIKPTGLGERYKYFKLTNNNTGSIFVEELITRSEITAVIKEIENNAKNITTVQSQHTNNINSLQANVKKLDDLATKIPALSGSNITIGNVNNVFSFNKNPITINDNPNLIHWKCELIPTEQTSASKIDIIADSSIEQIKNTKEIGYVGHTITLGNWGKYDIHAGDKITIEKINNIIVVEHILYIG